MSGRNEGMADCGHASYSTYNSGCRCDACRAENARAWRVRHRNEAYGRSYLVDAEPVRERLRELYDQGYTQRELGRMGISRTTQHALLHAHARTGRPVARCARSVAERVMSVRGRAISPRQLVSAVPSYVMLAHWRACGLSVAAVSRASGVNRQVLDRVIHREADQVQHRTQQALLDAEVGLELSRPRVEMFELDMPVVVTDGFGVSWDPMGAAMVARRLEADVRAVIVAARHGWAVGSHTLRLARPGERAAAPSEAWVHYGSGMPDAVDVTSRGLARATGTSEETIACYATPSHHAKEPGTLVERVVLHGER